MKNARPISLIKKSIKEGNFQEALVAIERLTKSVRDKDFENEVIQIYFRFNTLGKSRHLLSAKKIRQEENQLAHELLLILDRFSDKYFGGGLQIIDIFEEDSLRRTIEIIDATREKYEVYGGGIIRQRAYRSSFSIPFREVSDPLWKNWQRRYYEQIRLERYWLEKHVENHYCKLILKPWIKGEEAPMEEREVQYQLIRMRTLKQFLESHRTKIDVALIEKGKSFNSKNMLIVGNWFYAESNLWTATGWQNTTIKSVAVDQRIQEFDAEFYQLLAEQGLDTYESLDRAIEQLAEEIQLLKRR